METSTPLAELIKTADKILDKITQHPQFQKLQESGFQPDLNIFDAMTALEYIRGEINPGCGTTNLEAQ
ncbi:hypothetical protein [Anabaena sp. 4-3]|uniref:hypothetical protein n=1 Tax=Anabaena sp. 4-3 TaxID=1811979 RepID=UPI00082ED71F|nr:hypothetical protein [Anabaena sp. 4-3]